MATTTKATVMEPTDPEKQGGVSEHHDEGTASPPSQHPHEFGIDEAHQKRVIRRIDMRLLPILGIMYSISLVDRTNLGLALVAGMQEQLGLAIGDRYTIIVMIFFVTYIIFEIPSNLVLPKVGCANWLAFLGVGFGSILIGMGFTKDWGTLALCRALLGILEAGFLPGCTYLITCWYTRFEVGKRLAGFWILSVLTGGFSAIFAYVLSLLNGRAGLLGWSWIFIVSRKPCRPVPGALLTDGVCRSREP
jgi:MFS family permease